MCIYMYIYCVYIYNVYIYIYLFIDLIKSYKYAVFVNFTWDGHEFTG